jgi:hypothetical protein
MYLVRNSSIQKTFGMCTHLKIILSNMYTNVKKITGLFQRNLSLVSMSRVEPQDEGTPKIRGPRTRW